MRKTFHKLLTEVHGVFHILRIFRPCLLHIRRNPLVPAECHNLIILRLRLLFPRTLFVVDVENAQAFRRIRIDHIPAGHRLRKRRELFHALGKAPRIRRQHTAAVVVVVYLALTRLLTHIINAVDAPMPDIGECHVADLCTVHIDSSLATVS